MDVLAEVSDKVVTAGQFWGVAVTLSIAVAGVAVVWRPWVAMALAVLVSALGCLLTLSFLDDPIFGDAVLVENGWSWFAGRIVASLLPVVTVAVFMVGPARRRDAAGFEVVGPGRTPG
jgi:hypothetical protein